MVKCADCGFLAVRNLYTRELDEADPDYRFTGNPTARPRENRPAIAHSISELQESLHAPYPFCFERAYDLRGEVLLRARELASGPTPIRSEMEAAREIMGKERECSHFITWQLGSTPKEHRGMLDRQLMEEREERRDREMREWQAQQRKEDLDWRKRQEERAGIRFKLELLVLGVLIAAATIVAAYIQRGRQPTVINNLPPIQLIQPQSGQPQP